MKKASNMVSRLRRVGLDRWVHVSKFFARLVPLQEVPAIDIQELHGEPGYFPGEKCNRDGCEGIIQEHASDRGCTCFINPPCSHCVDSRAYCEECDWSGRDEQMSHPY